MAKRIPTGPDGSKRLKLFGTTIEVDKFLRKPEVKHPVDHLMETLDGSNEKLASVLIPEDPSNQEKKQAIQAKVNRITKPFQEHRPENPFGSVWGELTAQIAAERLGWTKKKVLAHLSRPEPSPAKTEQGHASAMLKRWLNDRFTDQGKKLAQEARLQRKVKAWFELSQQCGCNSNQAVEVVKSVSKLQADQAETSKIPNFSNLIKSLSHGLGGKETNIVHLHCLPRLNTPENGAEIITEMRGFSNNHGKVIIDQNQELNGLQQTLEPLNVLPVSFNLTVVVIDLCEHLFESKRVDKLDQGADKFIKGFRPLVHQRWPQAQIVKMSTLIGLNKAVDFLHTSIFERTKQNLDQVMHPVTLERLAEDTRKKLCQRDVPEDQKNFSTARRLAQREVIIESTTGEIIGRSFDKPIITQRSSSRAAAVNFLKGANKVNAHPPFLFFTTDREKV